MKAFLVFHRGALGDFVLTWPVLAALRRAYPQHPFIGVGRPDYLELAKALGLLDTGFDCEAAAWLPFLAGEALPEVLQDMGLEAALLWTGKNSNLRELLMRTCQGPVVFHSPFPETKSESGGDDGGKIHVQDHHLCALSQFSLSAVLGTVFESAFVASNVFPKSGNSYALVHPGSGSPAKNYAPGFYAEVAESLKERGWKDTRIVLGPVEAGLRRQYENCFTIEEPSSALELARLISGGSMFVGNDSGVSHLAAALGVRTVAFYRSTSPLVWGVCGRAAVSLSAGDEAEARTRLQEVLRDGKFTHPEFP